MAAPERDLHARRPNRPAAGRIHSYATQRPSVNVVTGVKANLPSRIASKSLRRSIPAPSSTAGRNPIGRGDMLFRHPAPRKYCAWAPLSPTRKSRSSSPRATARPYDQSVQQQIDRAAKEDEDGGEGGEDGDMGDDTALFQQAFDVLKSTKRASTSMIQRRLRIGYNRAARIMDLMEQKGIVGPENGSSPREILVDLDTYQP